MSTHISDVQLTQANQRRNALGSAVQVARARAMLHAATDAQVIEVLRARIDNPTAPLSEIAASLGLSKDTYWARLRRALRDAETRAQETAATSARRRASAALTP